MSSARRPFIRRPGAAPHFTAAEDERARTWLPDITEACLADPEWHQEGDERKYRHTGGLSINMVGKGWCDHSTEASGLSAIKLVMYLKHYSYPQTIQWLTAFLANHPGTGPCGIDAGGADDDDATPASATECREVLDRMQEDLTDTASKIYLTSRDLPGPYPTGLLGHLEDARVGESALVAKLTEHGRITGVQLTYLTPDGEKSLREPVRRRLNLERSPGAAFRIAPLIGRPT